MRLKINKHKQIKKQLLLCSLIVVLIIALSYLIIETDLLDKKINKTTASYITFNNQKTTDILQIENLKKYSDSKGKSISNKQYIELNITSDKKEEFDIVVYPLSNDIDKKYIKYFIKNDRESLLDCLNNKKESSDGGIIIYQGTSNNGKITLKMWISDKYKKIIKETAFEIKIKPR